MSIENYVPVNVRVMQFREVYPDGFITTEAITTQYGEKVGVRFTARVYRNSAEVEVGVPAAMGHSELLLDDEKVLEKAETAAVGRAIAFLGFSIQDNVASSEEMENYQDRAKVAGQAKTRFPAKPAPEEAPVEDTKTSASSQLDRLHASRSGSKGGGGSSSRLPASFKNR